MPSAFDPPAGITIGSPFAQEDDPLFAQAGQERPRAMGLPFVAMDDDTRDLIAQLCARIWMIMEDASAVALSVPGISEVERDAAIVEISDAAARISALSAATTALIR